jgi:hypothetical protein
MKRPTCKVTRRDVMEAAIRHTMRLSATPNFVSHVAEKATLVVRRNLHPLSYHSFHNSESGIPSVTTFADNVSGNSRVRMPTMTTSLACLGRLRLCLSPTTKGNLTSTYRLFLAALILAANNLNDTSPTYKHWVRHSLMRSYDDNLPGISIADVNLMKIQLLILLHWNFRISLHGLQSLFQPVQAAMDGPRLLRTTHSEPEINSGHTGCMELTLDTFTKASSHPAQHRLQRRRLRRWRKLSKGILQLTAKVLMNRVLTI